MNVIGDEKINRKLSLIEDQLDKLIYKLSNIDEESDIEQYMRNLRFIEEELEVLNILELNNKNKKKYIDLISDIKKIKKDNKYRSMINKLEILEMLRELTDSKENYSRIEILDKTKKILKKLIITEEDLHEIIEGNLIYVNKIKSFTNVSDENFNSRERLKVSLELLDNLFNMIYESYLKSKIDFNIYEKIMTITILDNVIKVLRV